MNRRRRRFAAWPTGDQLLGRIRYLCGTAPGFANRKQQTNLRWIFRWLLFLAVLTELVTRMAQAAERYGYV
jgi:hypothetical protein